MRRVSRAAADEGAMSAELEILLPETLEAVPCNLCGSWDAQEIYPAAERRNGHALGLAAAASPLSPCGEQVGERRHDLLALWRQGIEMLARSAYPSLARRSNQAGER